MLRGTNTSTKDGVTITSTKDNKNKLQTYVSTWTLDVFRLLVDRKLEFFSYPLASEFE
jgi:hypothetical protein